jgi:8-oxo-dGTP pyrophosphatase MutT (NUDIX family)
VPRSTIQLSLIITVDRGHVSRKLKKKRKRRRHTSRYVTWVCLCLSTAVYVSVARSMGQTSASIDTTVVPPSVGCTLELCAGIIDKEESIKTIACGEIREETGYDVKPEQLEFITSYRLELQKNRIFVLLT